MLDLAPGSDAPTNRSSFLPSDPRIAGSLTAHERADDGMPARANVPWVPGYALTFRRAASAARAAFTTRPWTITPGPLVLA